MTIEFVSPRKDDGVSRKPWNSPGGGGYQDHVLRPEYEARKLRFPEGSTWFRIVPAMRGSAFDWMLPLRVINHEKGRFVHPRTVDRSTKSAFDHAYTWAVKNHPTAIYSSSNKKGVRLLPDPMALFWVLVEIDGRLVARLILGSGYDGSRGGAEGLGHHIWRLAREHDECGRMISDAVDPEAGMLVCVEKSQPKGVKFPSYRVKVGRQPKPIQEMIAALDKSELDVLSPLENVMQVPNEEEQWKLLAQIIAPDTAAIIRRFSMEA